MRCGPSADQGCRVANGTEMARPVRTTAGSARRRWHQLGRWARPVKGDRLPHWQASARRGSDEGSVGCLLQTRRREADRMRWRPGLGLTILAVAVVALGLLAVTGRVLAPEPAVPPVTAGSVEPSQASTPRRVMVPEPMVTWTPRPLPPEAPLETSTSRGVLVPDAVGKSLAGGQRLMRRVSLHGSANERDPQAPGSVIFAQEPPPGILVPPGSVVGFGPSDLRRCWAVR
jgi:hypothetical protein